MVYEKFAEPYKFKSILPNHKETAKSNIKTHNIFKETTLYIHGH